MSEAKQREVWVDNIKVIACVFVVLGHFFQSMTGADILPNNDLYKWFIQTIYYFHVPLFFICSGYLYQKLSVVNNLKSWGENVLKKALNLGVPYFAFSIATWVLKTVFSNSVNNEIDTGLFDTLFIHPASPYWYLYALFFIFLITPTFKNKTRAIIGLVIALAFRLFLLTNINAGIQAVSYILQHEIWFVIGMCLSIVDFNKYAAKSVYLAISIMAGAVFIVLSVLVYAADIQYGLISFMLGLIACFAFVMFMAVMFRAGTNSKIFCFFAKYTMPIFLMHTMFAAPLRAVLLKVGIHNPTVHIVLGIAISFIGPIIVAIIMQKSKCLEFFLYPGKFVRLKQNRRGNSYENING